jgi:hypothetical protein
MKTDFLTHVTENVQKLLASILEEGGMSLFRRSPRVVLGFPLDENSTDYHLYFTGHQKLETDGGSLRLSDGQGGVQVFKSPERIQYNFLIAANGMLVQSRIRSYDRLLSYFFDHKAISPFVPEEFKQYPGLYERLVKTPAEICLRPTENSQLRSGGLDGLRICLEYRALYHSGTLAGEENRVSQRVVNYAQRDEKERSAL